MFDFIVVDIGLCDLFKTSLRADQAHIWGQKTFMIENKRYMYWTDFKAFVDELVVY